MLLKTVYVTNILRHTKSLIYHYQIRYTDDTMSSINENVERIKVPPECHTQPLSKLSKKWNNMLNMLIDFKRKHGHCLVPNRYHENPQLGAWVSVQRRQFKDLQRNLPTPMTKERASLLESIGFKWSSKDPDHVAWKSRFEELKNYKQMHGNCSIPEGSQEYAHLLAWVKMLRRAYKFKMEGKANGISDEKIMKLNSIGFDWGLEDNISRASENNYKANDTRKGKEPPITASIGMSNNFTRNQTAEKASAHVPFVHASNSSSKSLGQVQQIPFRDSPQYLRAQQIHSHRQEELMFKLAEIKMMEDAVRLSMRRSMLHAQQVSCQGNHHPGFQSMAVANGMHSNVYVGEDGQLIFKDSTDANPTMAAQMQQVHPPDIKNIIAASYNTNPFLSNTEVQKLPSLKEYNASNTNACRVVTQDSVDDVFDDDQRQISARKKSSNKRTRFVSSRYPGPQTSDAFWWARFTELKKFREENGHCIVPNRYPPHPPLGNWVSTQRRQYKLWKSNKISSMNKERAKALERIGFSWVVRSTYPILNDVCNSKENSNSESAFRELNEIPSQDSAKTIGTEVKIENSAPENEDYDNSSVSTDMQVKEEKTSENTTNNALKRKLGEISGLDEDYFPYDNKFPKKCDDTLDSDVIKANTFVGTGVREVRMLNHFRRQDIATSAMSMEEKDEDSVTGDEISCNFENKRQLKRFF